MRHEWRSCAQWLLRRNLRARSGRAEPSVRLTNAVVATEDHAGPGGRRRHEGELPRLTVGREDGLAAAQHDRLDHQAQLVDEIVGQKGAYQRGASDHVDFT